MNEREIIKRAKEKYKLGARRLEKVIERDYGIHIPHNRIHQHLLKEGLAKEESKKKKRSDERVDPGQWKPIWSTQKRR